MTTRIIELGIIKIKEEQSGLRRKTISKNKLY